MIAFNAVISKFLLLLLLFFLRLKIINILHIFSMLTEYHAVNKTLYLDTSNFATNEKESTGVSKSCVCHITVIPEN